MTKIQAARDEYRNWCTALGVNNLQDLNELLDEGRGIELINLCEARQERKYAGIANQIYFLRDHVKIVMISGPSSSGKTSSSLRIAQQCRVLGISPKVIELDNYFHNRENTPRDKNGEYDFEALGAMDIELLNDNLNALLKGEEVEIPKFDFASGHRVYNGNKLTLHENDILFMEGIHALNPALTPGVDQTKIFRIYISALSALPGGEKVHFSTTDKRLLRRIVRDNRVRGASPEDTILRWPSVRNGETNNIFPFEENADVMFNSSTLYDLPLLKYFAEPLLENIKESSPAFPKATQLLKFLEAVRVLKPKEIAAVPPTSIMREFIGGQTL
ncbi:MAG: nucleoside kinase [Bacteroidales bacterium]|nr:nucleoside kinase [Bacteroidales bacterium]